jgi:potassium-dependent mechanosensitive channel
MNSPERHRQSRVRAASRRWRPGLALPVLLLAAGAFAQPARLLPGSVANRTAAAPASVAAAAVGARDPATRLQAGLAEAQSELNRALVSLSRGTNLPAGATPAEAIEYRSGLQRLVRTYQLHLDDLAALAASGLRQKELTETLQSWTGFTDPPPYSVLLVDDLRNSIQSFHADIKTAQVAQDVARTFVAEVQAIGKETDEELRRLAEQLESASDSGARTRLTWQRDLLRVRSRVAWAMAAAYETKRQIAEQELAEARQRLAFAQRQLALVAGQVRFTQADLDLALGNLAREQSGFERELQDAEVDLERQQNALAEAREALRRALQEPPGGKVDADAVRLQQDVVAVRDIEAQTGVQAVSVLRDLLERVNTQRQMWQMRFAVSGSRALAGLQAAQQRLVRVRGLLRAAQDYYRQQIETTANRIVQEQGRLLDVGEAARDPLLARERIQSYQQRETLYHRALQSLEKGERSMARWQEALDQDRRALPFTARVRDTFTQTSGLVARLWHFELFVVEDSITVDGQVIQGRRGVTVGKIAMAILILVVGYWVSNLAARFLERMAVRRLNVEPNQANLVRRWVRVVLVMGLVVFALVSVKIPLTVFAFAGGALAIGVGFGTQNLLKNFISGIIILFERPFRVGDVLDLGGHTGVVTGIGIRSCVLQRWDHTETLIPNSSLLENNLTNWTYSNHKVRFTVSVGVAYGSDTRRVAQLLAEVAERHGLVQKEPKPQVLFTDFGDSALSFELRYWVDVLKHNAGQVASDLRHMISGAFQEQGIILAFPQRDVHLAAEKPIAVRLCPPDPGGAA